MAAMSVRFVLFLFLSTQARAALKEWLSIEKKYAHKDRPLVSLWGHFLDKWLMWEGSAHYGQWHPWASGPGLVKKQAEHAEESKPESSLPLWSLLEFLPPGSACIPALTSLYDRLYAIRWNKPFPLLSWLFSGFSHSNRNQTKATIMPDCFLQGVLLGRSGHGCKHRMSVLLRRRHCLDSAGAGIWLKEMTRE